MIFQPFVKIIKLILHDNSQTLSKWTQNAMMASLAHLCHCTNSVTLNNDQQQILSINGKLGPAAVKFQSCCTLCICCCTSSISILAVFLSSSASNAAECCSASFVLLSAVACRSCQHLVKHGLNDHPPIIHDQCIAHLDVHYTFQAQQATSDPCQSLHLQPIFCV